jgi:hypothetical protein
LAGRNLALPEYFKEISTKIIPSTRHMFAMFEPRTFPIDMPTIANMSKNFEISVGVATNEKT